VNKDRRRWNAKAAKAAKGQIEGFSADFAHFAFDVVVAGTEEPSLIGR
jgi:hypothetical protein